MPALPPPPNPSLTAIVLVIQSRSGPRIVFHYPPHPLSTRYTEPSVDSTGESSSSDSDSDSSTSSQTESALQSSLYDPGRLKRSPEDDENDTSSPDSQDPGNLFQGFDWEPLLGLGTTGLENLLVPTSRIWHKRKFEISVNDLCFVGRPVFVKEDGNWRQKKKSRKRRAQHRTAPDDDEHSTDNEATVEGEDLGVSVDPKRTTWSSGSEIAMFNMVFVLQPPILEQTLRIREMYDNVIKKFSRALGSHQADSAFVSQQSELITKIKSKHLKKRSPTPVVYSEILTQSLLAKAIASTFDAISNSKIATITLGGTESISLHIPPIKSTSSIASLNDHPVQPGIWLTTVNEPERNIFPDDSVSEAPDGPLPSVSMAKHFTLLLLEEVDKLKADVQNAGGSHSAALIRLIEAIKSNKSLLKVANANNLQLTELHFLARHLVYWRRAVTIPPFQHRDCYMVSPNADLKRLRSASRRFKARFSTLPSLPKLLSNLSTPRPWAAFVPSGDHKETYFEILGWLFREGWVTQLRTFSVLSIDSETKKSLRSQASSAQPTVSTAIGETPISSRSSGHHSTSTHRPSIYSRPSSKGTSQDAYENVRESALLLNPQRASAQETVYLEHLHSSLLSKNYSGKALSHDERELLHRQWPSLVKYFDGMQSMEQIPVGESMKKSIVADALRKIGLAFGSTRDLPERGSGNESPLIFYRHW